MNWYLASASNREAGEIEMPENPQPIGLRSHQALEQGKDLETQVTSRNWKYEMFSNRLDNLVSHSLWRYWSRGVRPPSVTTNRPQAPRKLGIPLIPREAAKRREAIPGATPTVLTKTDRSWEQSIEAEKSSLPQHSADRHGFRRKLQQAGDSVRS